VKIVKVKDLIKFLQTLDEDLEVFIADTEYPTVPLEIGNITVNDGDIVLY
jgi:hypothetical protein